MNTRHHQMATFVAPDPPVIEHDRATIVVPHQVYTVVLVAIILIGVMAGAYLTMISDWSRVTIAIGVLVATVLLLVLSMIVLSGNLPAVLAYRAYDRHDRRLYKIRLEELSIESERIPVSLLIDPNRQAVIQWIRGMYLPDGTPNPSEVRPSGQLINTAPWSSRSANQRDGLAMLRILEDAGLVSTDGQNPVLNIQDCPTLDIALENLR